jgi:hypothetical protein
VGKPEGKRSLGRPRRRWVDNIKMDLREIGWGGVDWIERSKAGTVFARADSGTVGSNPTEGMNV